MTKAYGAYFIDLDGTIYAGKKRYPSGKRFIERLQAQKIPFLFVTNNTTKLPVDVVKNLADNHDIHVGADHVYTAGMATVDYVDQLVTDGNKTAYIVGESGLKQIFEDHGYTLAPDNPAFTIVALDSDVTYDKFAKATLAIENGSRFIGTNADSNIPKESGLLPGAGSLVKLVEYATRQPATYIGKPEPIIMNNALDKIGLTTDQVVMVGDNYNTDIMAGINIGMDTLLVYSGLSTRDDVQKQTEKPTYEIESLDDWELPHD